MPMYLLCPSKPDIDKEIVYGQTDLDVSKGFIMDCIKLLPEVASIRPDKIYCSPLRRSFKLAEKFSKELSIPLITDKRLKELHYGKWEMERWEAILPTELNFWMVDFVNVQTPEGESFMELSDRVNDFMNNNNIQNSLIVTHSGVIRAILCSLLNIPLNNCFKEFDIQCCKIYEIDMVRKKYQVLVN